MAEQLTHVSSLQQKGSRWMTITLVVDCAHEPADVVQDIISNVEYDTGGRVLVADVDGVIHYASEKFRRV